MTRVAHVITGLSAGGAEQQLLLLAGQEDDVTVVSLTDDGVVGEALRRGHVPVLVVGMRSNKDLRGLLRLSRLLRAGRFEVVHLHLFRALVHGALVARLAGVPMVVYTEHSLNDRLVEGRPVTAGVRLLYRLCTRLVDVVVAVSAPVRDRLREIGVRRPIRVIANAADAARFRFDPAAREAARGELGLGPDEVAVAVVGRLFHAKAVDVALAAIVPLLDDRHRLLVVGTGPEHDALRTQADELCRVHGVTGRVSFLGERTDVPELLSAMDLVVSPSPEETFGLAVVEARLAGAPVVAVHCPAFDGIDDHGLLRCGPDVADVRTALQAALSAPGAHRVPPPIALLDRCDVTTLAAELHALYTDPTGSGRTKVPLR